MMYCGASGVRGRHSLRPLFSGENKVIYRLFFFIFFILLIFVILKNILKEIMII